MTTLINFLSLITLLSFYSYTQTRPTIIMIHPAGDARHPGRQIAGYFERGLTLQCCDRLKNDLEILYTPNELQVVSTRIAGDRLDILPQAHFANRLPVDLLVSIHFYQEQEAKTQVYAYAFSYGDENITPLYDFQFLPYHQAYLINAEKTKLYMQQVKQIWSHKEHAHFFTFHGPFYMPFAPLIGIVAPAIAFEIGLKHKDDWLQAIQPLVDTVQSIAKAASHV